MPRTKKTTTPSNSIVTLAIDIGGSGIKGILLDQTGQPIGERLRISTPQPSTPEAVLAAIIEIAQRLGKFDRISVGFPGVVQHGRVKTAPNLDPSWPGTNLCRELQQALKKPVRAANDADVQGFGAITGKGVELVITLGTGFGTALFVNGHLVPNMEIPHHPFRKGQTYEEQMGAATLEKIGKKKWNKRLAKAIETLDRVINFDNLYIGGGNAKKMTISLPPNITVISNVAGLLGGIALWANPSEMKISSSKTSKKPKNKTTHKASSGKRTRSS